MGAWSSVRWADQEVIMAKVAVVRAKARALARGYKGDERGLVKLILETIGKDAHLAFELCRASKKAVLAMSKKEIESMLPRLCSWETTDCFGSFVSGVAWREGRLTDADIARWARSESLWVRRAALVSTVPLNQKARGATAPKGEAKKTLEVCEMLLDDREDMVVKAMSWALRVLCVPDPESARRFAAKHGERLAARAKRELGNKLRTGLKNP